VAKFAGTNSLRTVEAKHQLQKIPEVSHRTEYLSNKTKLKQEKITQIFFYEIDPSMLFAGGGGGDFLSL